MVEFYILNENSTDFEKFFNWNITEMIDRLIIIDIQLYGYF